MRVAALLLAILAVLPGAQADGQVRLAFAQRQVDTVYEGDLAPGRAILYELPFDEANLTRVAFRLAWDAPAVGSAGVASLDVTRPEGGARHARGSARVLDAVEADLNALPASVLVPASQLEGRLAAAEGHAGQGVWRVRLLLEDPGPLPVARHYRLHVQSLRYVAVPLEPQSGAGAPLAADVATWSAGAALGVAAGAGILACLALAARARRGAAARSAPPAGDNPASRRP